MKIAIDVPVVNLDGNESTLSFVKEDETVDILLDGEKICGADYFTNLVFLFQKALKIWGFAKESITDE